MSKPVAWRIGRSGPPEVGWNFTTEEVRAAQWEKDNPERVEELYSEDDVRELVTAATKLLETLPAHWHGEAEVELRDICEAFDTKADRRTPAPAEDALREAWQPISTAPKDGTHILIVNVRNGYMLVSYWEETDFMRGQWRNVPYIGTPQWATHWMPLPAPPALATSSTAKPGAAQKDSPDAK